MTGNILHIAIFPKAKNEWAMHGYRVILLTVMPFGNFTRDVSSRKQTSNVKNMT